MKKVTKLISLILAAVMLFSASCISVAAAAIPDAAKNSVEQLIQNKNLAELVGWLLTNLNKAKANVTGTLIKVLLLMLTDESLQAEIGGRDVTAMSDEQLANILLNWLDANLPEWSSDLTGQESWQTVTSICNLLGLTLDLNSVDGVVGTLYSICRKVNTDAIIGSVAGDLKQLDGSALNGVKRSGGDLHVIYALLEWLSDNQGLIMSFVTGGFGSNGVRLGNALQNIIGDNLDNVTAAVKNIPDYLKGLMYLLIDGYAETPDIQDNPKGERGLPPYAE